MKASKYCANCPLLIRDAGSDTSAWCPKHSKKIQFAKNQHLLAVATTLRKRIPEKCDNDK